MTPGSLASVGRGYSMMIYQEKIAPPLVPLTADEQTTLRLELRTKIVGSRTSSTDWRVSFGIRSIEVKASVGGLFFLKKNLHRVDHFSCPIASSCHSMLNVPVIGTNCLAKGCDGSHRRFRLRSQGRRHHPNKTARALGRAEESNLIPLERRPARADNPPRRTRFPRTA